MKTLIKKEAKKRMEKLIREIRRHDYLYYVLDRLEISDEAYDSLKKKLVELEKRFPEFVRPDSPSQRVGGKALEKFEKAGHSIPMLSIEDVFSEEELRNWEDYLERLFPSVKFDYFAEFKIDGFAVALIYENGILVVGATRGNGRVGENVIQNLKTIGSIPLRLEIRGKLFKGIEENIKRKIEKGRIEIRGEVYMEKAAFEKLNKELKKTGQTLYANPRNLAAGSIRQLDPKLAASRPLKFLAYDIITDLGQEKHSQEHQILKDLGFKTDPGKECKSLSGIVDFWRKLAKKREILPFQIDGVVAVVNDNSLFQKLGVAGKSPRGIRAFKFSPKQATTKVKDIKVQVGRTGAVTPVAYLEPVKIGGVTVSRATLHNESELKRLGVKIGDTVIVERAGDVIPAVSRVLTGLRSGKEKRFNFPRNCPACGRKLRKPKGEIVWRCLNALCSARRREFLYHFVSKKAFDIEGLGFKIIDQLMDENLISSAPDLFELEEGDLISLERFAEKSASNLVLAIRRSKKIGLGRFVYALGIRHVGEETAISLAQYFGSIHKLKRASRERLEALPDVGGKVSEAIYNWFRLKKNQRLIEDLLKVRVKILPPEKIGRKLKGQTFVLTGALENITRSEAHKKIRLLGGHPPTSISEKTDFLVLGKNPGSKKLEKARKLGIKILKEEEFLKMIK